MQQLQQDVFCVHHRFTTFESVLNGGNSIGYPSGFWPRVPSILVDKFRCFVIVIVNSCFLERPQKQSRRNQLIHRRLTKTKSIGSGQDPESQAARQSDGYGGWCLELRRGGRYGGMLVVAVVSWNSIGQFTCRFGADWKKRRTSFYSPHLSIIYSCWKQFSLFRWHWKTILNLTKSSQVNNHVSISTNRTFAMLKG